ncbi:SNF2 family N-terminal domain-containing protein [Hypoxylon sp. FL1284]|nr:SNF2 family N-terminal domain-containing protein [Hypoxylon sp. FL1284]
MSRPASSKMTDKRQEGLTHMVTELEDERFSESFLNFLRRLPSDSCSRDRSVNRTGDGEPLRKRARTQHFETIPIAREAIILDRPLQSGVTIPDSLSRTDLQHHLSMRYDEVTRVLTLVNTARVTKTVGVICNKFDLSSLEFTKGMLAVLAILGQAQPDDSDNESALWVKVTAHLQRKKEDHLQLSLELNWNTTSWCSLQGVSKPSLCQKIIDTFFPNDTPVLDHVGENNTLSSRAFYDAAFIPERDQADLSSLSVPGLTPNLYPFQRRTLQWLLRREGVRWSDRNADGVPGLEPLSPPSTSTPPLSFREAKDADSKLVYISDLYHIVTRDVTSFAKYEASVRGGLLAEEMGLGKTVETIALICLHVRDNPWSRHHDAVQNLYISGATLIVAPSTLRNQWVSEFAKHAPHLKVMVYEGLKGVTEQEQTLASRLAQHDVVITTYNVLQVEIHYAQEPPSRYFRHERKYHHPKSPLIQISWWRVCLDEAQQIENGMSNASKVARLIPRVNSWGITGTPVKKDIRDLWGLLLFLGYEPFASSIAKWYELLTKHQALFYPLFNSISLRHTKRFVRDELTLPPQKRYVITMPFTAVEEQHYKMYFKEMVASAGLEEDGTTAPDGQGLDSPITIHHMDLGLHHLRQVILHPSLRSGRPSRYADRNGGALRTVDEVLDAMIEKSESLMKTEQRNYLLSKLERGQLLANQSALHEAIALWQEVLDEVVATEEQCRNQLQAEIEKAKQENPNADPEEDAHSSSSEDEDPDAGKTSSRVGECRRQLRSILDLHHRALFFTASAYFQLKSEAEESMDPGSDGFKSLEEKEVSGYEAAKVVRKEIMNQVRKKALKLIGKVRDKAASQSFVEVPEINWDSFHGIESVRILGKSEKFGAFLNQQANLVDEWRESTVQLLLRPLVDDDEAETTGEEYADSTRVQDDLMVYTLVLRAAIADRHYAFSGLDNERVRYETRAAAQQAEKGEGHAPRTVLKLLQQRDQVRLPSDEPSFRQIISELRELASKLRSDVTTGSNRARIELEIVQQQLRLAQEQNSAQTKAVTELERELDAFTATMNARVAYYRQLQAISDTVNPLDMEEVGDVDEALRALLSSEQTLLKKMTAAGPNHRYLLHLKEQGATADMCIICRAPFTLGVLTVCGHHFCKECITLWMDMESHCPLCKKPLGWDSLHDITLKKRELKIHQEELQAAGPSQMPKSKLKKVGIYSQFSAAKLDAINSIDLHGQPFGTKIDTLARHLLWLRVEDPGAKSVIFSQFGMFFDILRRAFDQYGIEYVSFKRKDSAKKFREDASIECFLMDARAHASGLNLVNASHVFLCEPLLNTALELQAIARVDRIGQMHETTVWLYLIEDTVEEAIYNLSVQRRLEHLHKSVQHKGKSKGTKSDVSDVDLEVANSLELEEAGAVSSLTKSSTMQGEVVDSSDLWQCLFGHLEKTKASADDRRNDGAVMRFLAGEAAEERRAS